MEKKDSSELTKEEGAATLEDAYKNERDRIREQKIKLMQDVAKKLKPRYRRLVELRYFKEFSYYEISQELELPIGTVKAQLFRAREFLFNILKNQEGKI